jgi:hypothetical protein
MVASIARQSSSERARQPLFVPLSGILGCCDETGPVSPRFIGRRLSDARQAISLHLPGNRSGFAPWIRVLQKLMPGIFVLRPFRQKRLYQIDRRHVNRRFVIGFPPEQMLLP